MNTVPHPPASLPAPDHKRLLDLEVEVIRLRAELTALRRGYNQHLKYKAHSSEDMVPDHNGETP